MIKNLFEPEENQPEKIKTEAEEKTAGASASEGNFESYFAGIETPSSEPNEPRNLSDISESADDELIFSEKPEEITRRRSPVEPTADAFDFSAARFNQPQELFPETTNHESFAETEPPNDEPLAGFPSDEIDFDSVDETTVEKFDVKSAAETSNETAAPTAETVSATTNYESPAQAVAEESKFENSGTLFQSSADQPPQSFAETARQSGLAYAAAVMLFGSIIFMLIIGWFADLLLDSSPWGVVGGIVLGAAIGFFQFFRLTAQIFKNKE